MRLIDADRLIKKIEDNCYCIKNEHGSIEAGMTLFEIQQFFAEEPEVEAEPVRYGKWVKNDPDDTVVYCAQCLMPQDSVCNYCPNCGAKMDLV